MAKILLVEDDRELCKIINDWLAPDHIIDSVENGTEGFDRLQFYQYDLAILDWSLPGMSGIDICKKYREGGGRIPVLMLTGKNTILEKEQGLDSGADDYLTKPFHPRELSARLRALLRRPQEITENVLKTRDIVLDPRARQVTRNGVEVQLLPREFALLEFLMRHPGEVFSDEALLERVWSSESEVSPDTVKVHIGKLRKKLDTDGTPSIIRTLHRQGYRLEG